MRIDAARAKFFELKDFFRNHKILRSTRISFLNALVRSRLTYGLQNWILSPRQLSQIESAYIGYLRHICKGGHQTKRVDHENTDTTKADHHYEHVKSAAKIREICGVESLKDFITSQQTRWVGHLLRSSNMRAVKQLSFESSKKHKSGTLPMTIPKIVTSHYLQKDTYSSAQKVHQDIMQRILPAKKLSTSKTRSRAPQKRCRK